MQASIRLLTNEDLQAFEGFLKCYEATSMFLRSNAQRVGLEFKEDKDYHAYYFGAFRDGQLTGVIALNWNGNLFVQVPDLNVLQQLLYYAATAIPTFAIKGILGPEIQAQALLKWFNTKPDNLQMSRTEVSYDLELGDMVVPSKLLDGSWKYRLAKSDDIPLLKPWRLAYEAEIIGIAPSEQNALIQAQENILHRIALNEIFLLEDQGQVVSRADYNATLPDVYQIGGVWTPPALRNNGYARGAVAGALLAAKRQGVQKAILFTNNPAAMRAYESLGFKAVDEYHITFFIEPVLLANLNGLSNRHPSQ